jgi:hypothetical protein
MFKEESTVNEYAMHGLRADVEKTVAKIISVRQKWIAIVIIGVFITYVFLAVWIWATVNNIKTEILATDAQKRELLEYQRATDSLKRVVLFDINSNYEKSIEEWKKRRTQK